MKSELVRKKGTMKAEKGSRGRDRCSKAEEEENLYFRKEGLLGGESAQEG